jgi:hypothetical protein
MTTAVVKIALTTPVVKPCGILPTKNVVDRVVGICYRETKNIVVTREVFA